jgi:protein TonB
MDHLALAGARPDRLRTVGLSFGVSVGIHVVVVMLLVTSFSRAAKRAPLVVQRVKLVWVDPAPAAAPPKGAPEGTAEPAAVIAPPPVTPPPKPVAAPKPVPKPVRAKKPEEAKAKPVPPPPPAASAPAPAEPAAPAAPAIAEGAAHGLPGAAGDTPGGTADGVAGGRVGGSGVLRVGDVATAPVLVNRIVPEYPRRARLAGIEGEVVLEVIVDRHGRVTGDVRVVAAVPELERAAVAAVQRWRFKPARDHRGEAVAVLMEVPVRFVLSDAR